MNEENAPPTRNKKRMTVDEILDEISQIAQDTEAGADRFRALKMLADQQSAAIAIQEPMTDGEVVDRLARVMHGAGVKLSQAAYQRAFPSARDAASAGRNLTYSEASPEMMAQAKEITSLPLLNKAFPEFKTNGVPKGFPSGRSAALKIQWCRDQALKYLIERENRLRQEAHEKMRDGDSLVRATTEATEGEDAGLHPEGLPEPGVP